MRILKGFSGAFVAIALMSCGQEAAFVSQGGEADGSIDPNLATDDPSGISSDDPNGIKPTPTDDGNPGPDPGVGGGGGETTGPTIVTEPTIIKTPTLNEEENSAIKKCLVKWGKVPFGTTINVRTIKAAVTVGGFGTAVNDTVKTEKPELVLIKAAVNVGSDVEYNLLNPNGYYCMTVNVNVDTNLTINLSCQARLADTKVLINGGGSTSPDGVSEVGVNVGSQVTLNNIVDGNEQCIR